MENIEIWKDVKDYEGLYQVSNLGRIKSLARDAFNQNGTVNHHVEEKILVPIVNNSGYLYVNLYKNGKRKFMLVHRLVALVFIPNPENKSQINHRDEVKTNNVVENLEWCSAQENANYGTRTARIVQNNKYPKLGDSPIAKAVFCEELNKTFDCITSAGKELGVNSVSISQVCKGKRKTAGGFHWKYVDD